MKRIITDTDAALADIDFVISSTGVSADILLTTSSWWGDNCEILYSEEYTVRAIFCTAMDWSVEFHLVG